MGSGGKTWTPGMLITLRLPATPGNIVWHAAFQWNWPLSPAQKLRTRQSKIIAVAGSLFGVSLSPEAYFCFRNARFASGEEFATKQARRRVAASERWYLCDLT